MNANYPEKSLIVHEGRKVKACIMKADLCI